MTFQRRLLLAAGGGWLFDAMDLLLLGSVVAAVSRQWDLSRPVAGWIITANLLGMFFGAALSGVVADRFGRKAVFTWTILAYSLLTGLSALATGAALLIGLRFLAGLGLGGELPVASTLVAEFAPAERRGRTVVLLESFWAYGSVLAALIGAVVVPLHEGWRIALLIGMLPALYVVVIRRAIPESPRWLLAQGRAREASEAARTAGIAAEAPAEPLRASLGQLFGPGLRRRTVMLWALWIALVFSYYGIFTWLPSLLTAKGFTLREALWLNLAIAVFQIPGYYAAAALVDRIGRKATLVVVPGLRRAGLVLLRRHDPLGAAGAGRGAGLGRGHRLLQSRRVGRDLHLHTRAVPDRDPGQRGRLRGRRGPAGGRVLGRDRGRAAGPLRLALRGVRGVRGGDAGRSAGRAAARRGDARTNPRGDQRAAPAARRARARRGRGLACAMPSGSRWCAATSPRSTSTRS